MTAPTLTERLRNAVQPARLVLHDIADPEVRASVTSSIDAVVAIARAAETEAQAKAAIAVMAEILYGPGHLAVTTSDIQTRVEWCTRGAWREPIDWIAPNTSIALRLAIQDLRADVDSSIESLRRSEPEHAEVLAATWRLAQEIYP